MTIDQNFLSLSLKQATALFLDKLCGKRPCVSIRRYHCLFSAASAYLRFTSSIRAFIDLVTSLPLSIFFQKYFGQHPPILPVANPSWQNVDERGDDKYPIEINNTSISLWSQTTVSFFGPGIFRRNNHFLLFIIYVLFYSFLLSSYFLYINETFYNRLLIPQLFCDS